MNRFEPMDPRRWKRGAKDMGQGTHFVLPDNGMQFEISTMRKNGFTLYQDFQHADGHKTRWWFRNTKTWSERVPGIEKMRYVAIDKLMVA